MEHYVHQDRTEKLRRNNSKSSHNLGQNVELTVSNILPDPPIDEPPSHDRDESYGKEGADGLGKRRNHEEKRRRSENQRRDSEERRIYEERSCDGYLLRNKGLRD